MALAFFAAQQQQVTQALSSALLAAYLLCMCFKLCVGVEPYPTGIWVPESLKCDFLPP